MVATDGVAATEGVAAPDDEREIKRARLEGLRAGRPLVLTSHEAISWYLGGVRTHVSLAGPPVLAVRVDDLGDRVYVAANERDRLVSEELAAADADLVVAVPWQTPPAAAADAAAADADGEVALDEAQVAGALRAARASLLPVERDRYRRLGGDVAQVLTDVASRLRESDTEREAAADLAGALMLRGVDPLVVLVAGAERVRHRHPLPTGTVLGPRAMLVVCGRRQGLIANATRWVGASGPDDTRILDVEVDFFAATRPGRPLSAAFAAGVSGYGAAGFDPDEWRRHHQGGPTGYAGRDPRATLGVDDLVQEHQAFAWNPSAPGAKVEDTVLVTSAGIEVLTADPRWPSTMHGGLQRPLARPFG